MPTIGSKAMKPRFGRLGLFCASSQCVFAPIESVQSSRLESVKLRVRMKADGHGHRLDAEILNSRLHFQDAVLEPIRHLQDVSKGKLLHPLRIAIAAAVVVRKSRRCMRAPVLGARGWQPVVKVWLHSTGDASTLAALLRPQIRPGILGCRALPARRLARLDAAPDFHHGLLRRGAMRTTVSRFSCRGACAVNRRQKKSGWGIPHPLFELPTGSAPLEVLTRKTLVKFSVKTVPASAGRHQEMSSSEAEP